MTIRQNITTIQLSSIASLGLLGATMFGCDENYQSAKDKLEPIAQEWLVQPQSKYMTFDQAFEGVYIAADMDRNGHVSGIEADTFIVNYNRGKNR